ncbi:MAG: DUF5723 family protein, partial [Bacteroidales bacterium]
QSQNSQVMYFMNLPQNHLQNPAYRPPNLLYIVPGVFGFDFTITNNLISFSDLFTSDTEISKSTLPFLNAGFDNEKFLSEIKTRNYIEPQFSVQLLGFGIEATKNLYLYLDIIDHFEGNFVVPRDMIRLAFLGNQEFVGQTFNLSALKAEAMYYREIGVGFSLRTNPRLRIGARAKLLYGIAAADLKTNSLALTVNDNQTNTLDADVLLNISAPIVYTYDNDHMISGIDWDPRLEEKGGMAKFLTSIKNPGLGLDLGVEFDLTDRITLSGSVTDLGYIVWKKDINTLKAQKTIQLEGIDFADIQNGSATIEDLGRSFQDSIKQAVVVSNSANTFTTFVPVGATVAGKYKINDKFSVGLLSYTRIVNKQAKEAVSLSGNLNIGNIFSASLAYTACNYSYNNIGIGLAVRGGFTQFYFLTDRIPLSWKTAGNENQGITLPANWNMIQARFGMNLVFGAKEYAERDTRY